MCVPLACLVPVEGQERKMYSHKPELQMVVSYRVGARSRKRKKIPVLRKSSKCS